mmetsp:Transcript_3982/g.8241  ORF Transcript_3982/g.8241 Transcript_3982/m.8241 type:complete len:184 (+) Transcript_3982:19-570(+)
MGCGACNQIFTDKDSLAPKAAEKRMPTDLIDGMKRLLGNGDRLRNPLSTSRRVSIDEDNKLFGRRNEDELSTHGSTKRKLEIDYLRPDYKSKTCVMKKEESFFDKSRKEKLQLFQRIMRDSIDSPKIFSVVSESEEEQTPQRMSRLEISSLTYTPSFQEKAFELTEESTSKGEEIIQDIDARV